MEGEDFCAVDGEFGGERVLVGEELESLIE